MFGASSEPVPDSWEPPFGGAVAEPFVPRLIAMFGLRACWYESFPFDVQLPRIEPGRIVLPAEEAGVSSWSLDLGVELPVRYRDLTLGRYVLVPATPTTGADFSPAARAEAIAMVGQVGTVITAGLMAETDSATSWNAVPAVDPIACQRAGDASAAARSHPRALARHLRRVARRARGDLQ